MPLPDSERDVFTDLYRFYEKHQPRRIADAAGFTELMKEIDTLISKHDSLLSRVMFMAVYQYFGELFEIERGAMHEG